MTVTVKVTLPCKVMQEMSQYHHFKVRNIAKVNMRQHDYYSPLMILVNNIIQLPTLHLM